MRLGVTLDILNQKGTPAFFADTLANRPAAGFTGRIFVSTDTLDLYRDTGTTWVLLSPSSTGTITGTGTTNTLPLFTGSTSLGNSALTQTTGVNITIGSVGTPYDFIGYGNNYANKFIVNGATNTQILVGDGTTITAGTGITISGGTISTTGGITGTGSAGQVSFWSGASSISGNNNLFWDNVNGHLGIGTTTPSTALSINHNQNQIIQINQTTFGNNCNIAYQSNGITNWRVGNSYNVGANDFAFYDVLNSAERFSIKTTGQTFVGTQTTSSGLLVVNNSTADQHLVVLGASSPSMRVRNAGTAPTYQFGIGLATTSNNFIQGTTLGEMCIFNDSSINSPILFGIRDSGTGLTNEAARISSLSNFLIGTTTDTGQKLQVNGTALITGAATFNNNVTTNTQLKVENSTGTALDMLVLETGFSNPSGNKSIIWKDSTSPLGRISVSYDAGTGSTMRFGSLFDGGYQTNDLFIITSNGNVLIGTTTNGGSKLRIVGLPTSAVGLSSGDIYSNAGILTIVP